MATVWDREEWLAADRQARTVTLPSEGESERVVLREVFERKAWFPEGGIYVLRSGDVVMYVGLTVLPLRPRLKGVISRGTAWAASSDYPSWTVTMQRTPAWPDDHGRLQALISELHPVFNVMGRPRKVRPMAVCRCRGVCSACGLPKVGIPPAGTRRRKV